MSTSNTSFEHVLHNLQERDQIMDDTKATLDRLFNILSSDNTLGIIQTSLNNVNKRVNCVYDDYKSAMERFSIGITTFVFDYYTIMNQHSDQFHSKYLHTYSGHREHYSPIIQTNNNTSFDINELINIFTEHCYELKKFKLHTGSSHLRRSKERTWAIYQKLSNYISSESVYDHSDLFLSEVEMIIVSISQIVDKNKKKDLEHVSSLLSKLKCSIQQFNNIRLDFKPSEEMIDYCECGSVMQIMSGSSEMVCDNCGYLYELKGTVFSDEQFYAQDGTRYKHAGYEPSKHCKCWLERIQARETNTITEKQLAKIEACIKRDGITNKKRLTIEQLRRYLKDTGLTELNEHVALIKRLITGVAPPQLTFAETQDITNSFSKAVKAYHLIRPSFKQNILFYPFLLWKLIEMHVSDYNKRKSLLSFIHLQGTQTLIQNDQIWMQVCNVTRGFNYRPTDRYEYMD